MDDRQPMRLGSRSRYKSFVNLLRSTFHLSTTKSIAKEAVVDTENAVIEDCQVPSTSSTPSVEPSLEGAPSVYEDPFVAVTADRCIHIKNYYSFNPRAEFTRTEQLGGPMRAQSRCVHVSRLRTIYFSLGNDESSNQTKTWGLSRSGVWWASHLNRESSDNSLYNIVLDDGSPIKPGFTVVSVQAFVGALWELSLPQECLVKHSLPFPPLNSLDLPFIDADDETTEEISDME